MVQGSIRTVTNLTSISVAAAEHCAVLLPEGPPQIVTSALQCFGVRECKVTYLSSPVCSLHLPSPLVNGVFPVDSERWELNLILVTFLRRLLKKVILLFNSYYIYNIDIFLT